MAVGSDARTCAAAISWWDNRPSLLRRLKPSLFPILSTLWMLGFVLVGGKTTLAEAGEMLDPGRIAAELRSPIANPYCTVPTFATLSLPGLARALLEGGDKPLILIETEIVASGAYARFLLAHECCHHRRGHLARLAEQQRRRELAWQSGALPAAQGTRPGVGDLSFTMSHRSMELDADCCAATLLAEQGDEAGLAAGVAAMEAFGARPTGPSYPPGLQRALMIKSCAAAR
jgi:hypothetical protein